MTSGNEREGGAGRGRGFRWREGDVSIELGKFRMSEIDETRSGKEIGRFRVLCCATDN